MRREIQDIQLPGVDVGVIDLQEGADTVDVGVVRMGNQDGADVEPVLLHRLQERSVEHARVHQHAVAAVVGPDEVGVGKPQPREEGEEYHVSSSWKVASFVLEE